jgi:hypothetical protein
LPPAHVVVDVPDSVAVLMLLLSVAVAAKLTHPESFAVTVILPVVELGFADIKDAQVTLLVVADKGENGTIAKEAVASATAKKRRETFRPIDLPPCKALRRSGGRRIHGAP